MQKQSKWLCLDKKKLKDVEVKRNLSKQFKKKYVQQEDLQTPNAG